MKEDNGVLVGHVGCPACGSSDNLALYMKEDGRYDAFCWGGDCGKFYSHNELVDDGILSADFKPDVDKIRKVKERITKEELVDIAARTNFSGKMSSGKQYRGIKDTTLEFFRHRFERNARNEITAVYYPETSNGEIQGYKSRVMPKRFGLKNIGKTGLSNQLSGQHLFNGGRFIVIVGGEEDKCAAWQMLNDYSKSKGEYESPAVVSPTCGEGSAVKQVAAQFDFFDKFETIVIMMDNDKAGIEAADAVAKVLPSEKVKIARLPMKDPCDMLIGGFDKQFVSCFYSAKEFAFTDIKSSDGIIDDIASVLTATKITLPPYMHVMEKMMKRAWSTNGRVVNIIGDTSCGKSTHVNNMTYHWTFHEGLKPLIMSLEMTSGEYAIDLLSLHLKKNLDWFEEGQDALDYLERDDVKALYKDLFTDEYGNERFRIVDDRDGKLETMQKQIERGVKQYGCNIVIIDVLSDVLRFLPMEDQMRHMAWQKNFVKSGVSIVNVLHTTKPSRDKEGKLRKTTEYDALGTGSFVQSAHINIVINRDKMATDPLEKNTTYVDMPKCRRGSTGEAGEWVYDVPTRQCYDKQDYLSMKYQKPVDNVVAVVHNDPVIEESF